MRILYYFFAYYFTAFPGEYQASIGDFAACLQRRMPQPRQQLYRTAPAVPMPPHYGSMYFFRSLEHPPACGRASAASERPRRPCGWGRRGASAERRVAPALPGARRPAGPERIATAYALLYDDGGAARLRGRDRERTGRNPLRPSGLQFVNLCKNCREHWCAGRWKNVPYCKN